jgi:hypothetical protein
VNHASRGLQSGKAFARKLGHQPGKFANMDTSPQRFPKCYQRLRNSSQRTPEMAAQKGMDEMSEKFREMGSSIYLKS